MRIALLSNDDFSVYHFRKGLIDALVQKGFDVYVIVPPGDFIEKLQSLSVKTITIPMCRFFSPLRDIVLVARLFKIFNKNKFDVVHTMTIKPNIYGSIAAKLAGVKKIFNLVSGAGFVFSSHASLRERIIRKPVSILYRLGLSCSKKTWFQNGDDLNYFVKRQIIKQEKGIVIRSGGINTYEYSKSVVSAAEKQTLRNELNIPQNGKCVLMVAARMIWSKGVREYIEAAKKLNDRYSDWFFVMVCPTDHGTPDVVSEEFLVEAKIERLRIIRSFRLDIKVFESICDIMVLPSYYPEGVPRTLLEGLAMSKPIITTDHPGCREVVDDGKNGYLVPVQNTEALTNAIERLIIDPIQRELFGKYSRKKAEQEFDEKIIVDRILKELYGI